VERQLTPKELNQLGDKAFYGRDQERNIEVAYTYYKQAADMNNPVGIYNVGKYYYQKAEYKKAFDYFKKATDLNYAQAYIRLYQMYLKGVGVRKSKKKAFKYLKMSAEQHNIESYHLLAQMYEEGIGTRRQDDKALHYYELSASKNNVEGMYLLALYLLKQKHKDQNHERAFEWLDKAANMHHQPSILHLIKLYQEPHPLLKKRSTLYLQEMQFHYKELLAKTKDIDALKLVAKTYEFGETYVSINYRKAFEYYRILHELDEVEGYLGLGRSYLYGLGVDQDYELAKDYLEIAGSRNVYEAKNLLGDIYRHGYGVQADYEKAKSYYLGAAEGGNVDAFIHLSLLHYHKQLPHASQSQALTYIKRATEVDHPKAYFWLGLYYEMGVGTDKDIDSAISAYKKAIQLGNQASRYQLANLLYKQLKKQSLSKRKTEQGFEEIKNLLLTYIEGADEDNRLKAMYLLGDLFKEPQYSKSSDKISRYYYELAAENNYPKAMNRMYEIHHDEDINHAIQWLEKAVKQSQDGESLYLLALAYDQGEGYLSKDHQKAHQLLEQAAQMKYTKAIEKLTLKGDSQ